MPSIDVIVPCYRYAHYLRACVTSILAERELAVRVIIIDDASPDNTPEVAEQLAREDSRVTYRRHTTNLRHIATYNEGIEWLESDYMLLLSADDYLLPGALRRVVDFLEAHPAVGFAHGRAILSPDGGITEPPSGSAVSNQWRVQSGADFIATIAARGTINFVATPTAIVRTKLQQQVGGYRPELPHSGDMEMWLRLAAHADVAEFDGFLAVWRRHETNMHIGYCGPDYGVADLKQRRAAVDCFVEACGHRLKDATAVREKLMEPVAFKAVKEASGAFNDGQSQVVEELTALACGALPQITGTHAWRVLQFKQLLGMRLWRSVFLPVTRALRRK